MWESGVCRDTGHDTSDGQTNVINNMSIIEKNILLFKPNKSISAIKADVFVWVEGWWWLMVMVATHLVLLD